MTETPWTRRLLRAPREDFAILASPSLPAALESARHNHDLLGGHPAGLQGRTVEQMREWSRAEVVRAAREYTGELLSVFGETLDPADDAALAEPGSNALFFVAGHQPSLFHPGVWVKNFAISELSRRSRGVAVNLIVDTDVMATARIRVPTGSREAPRVELVAFDADRVRGPWEENAILDRACFEGFGGRVESLLAPWRVTPLLRTMWPDAVRASSRLPLLRDCLVAARIRVERRWGAGNLELPISRLCELSPFLWFASHVLVQLPRFCQIYNQILAEYRVVNRVRSHTHPVPALTERDGWFEAPFWIWHQGDRVRGRLFARQEGGELALADGRKEVACLPISPEKDACCAVEVLRELPRRGYRLRARALATTLFSRLCLADLFVHGIGGAKYDEMTDRILHRFYGVPVPHFLTLTATLHAPLAEPHPARPQDEARLVRLLRDLQWNPDRHLDVGGDRHVAGLIAEKSELAQALGSATRSDGSSSSRGNYERFRRIHEVNSQLAELLAGRRERAQSELDDVRRALAINAILRDRDYAFCLYPEDKLRALMASLWQAPSAAGGMPVPEARASDHRFQ